MAHLDKRKKKENLSCFVSIRPILTTNQPDIKFNDCTKVTNEVFNKNYI